MLGQKWSWMACLAVLLMMCQHAYSDHGDGGRRGGRKTWFVKACDGQTASLNCGRKLIHVLLVKYGRLDKQTCAEKKKASQLANTKCFQPKALQIVKTRCNGKRICSVTASTKVFPDPCPKIDKYLTVTYECLRGKSGGKN